MRDKGKNKLTQNADQILNTVPSTYLLFLTRKEMLILIKTACFYNVNSYDYLL